MLPRHTELVARGLAYGADLVIKSFNPLQVAFSVYHAARVILETSSHIRSSRKRLYDPQTLCWHLYRER